MGLRPRQAMEDLAAVSSDAMLLPDESESLSTVPIRHWGTWMAAGFLLLLMASAVYSIAQNPRVGWSIIGDYLVKDYILHGVLVTLQLTVISMVIGVIGGTVLAIMRLSKNPVLLSLAQFYLWVFRGTPLLVQLLFWFFFAALYPRIYVGVPFTQYSFFSVDAGALIGPGMAAILGLGFNEAAYASELVRAGIISVDAGQTHAAQSLGMSQSLMMRRIVLPQAMRVIIPPMGNEFIGMLKTTSLVVVISGTDLLSVVTRVYGQTFEQIPLLIVACIWYLLMTTVFSIAQYYLERHYDRGTGVGVSQPAKTPRWRRWPGRWGPSQSPPEASAERIHERPR